MRRAGEPREGRGSLTLLQPNGESGGCLPLGPLAAGGLLGWGLWSLSGARAGCKTSWGLNAPLPASVHPQRPHRAAGRQPTEDLHTELDPGRLGPRWVSDI